ncbi:hypothetical protein H5410_040245 [Solanum commersonii]|uniref:Uncharacterized protein n=1 Tax=Solanum commersonii TaxID=4109 RepID=A0A9J5XNC3_SOLCO|nr:hypothetical protein H5410_040245 [Solanum commersonii]
MRIKIDMTRAAKKNPPKAPRGKGAMKGKNYSASITKQDTHKGSSNNMGMCRRCQVCPIKATQSYILSMFVLYSTGKVSIGRLKVEKRNQFE